MQSIGLLHSERSRESSQFYWNNEDNFTNLPIGDTLTMASCLIHRAVPGLGSSINDVRTGVGVGEVGHLANRGGGGVRATRRPRQNRPKIARKQPKIGQKSCEDWNSVIFGIRHSAHFTDLSAIVTRQIRLGNTTNARNQCYIGMYRPPATPDLRTSAGGGVGQVGHLRTGGGQKRRFCGRPLWTAP